MYILFDIGGTHMRVALSRDGKTISEGPIIVPTPQLFDDGVARFTDIAQKLLGGEKCIAAAGGVAGPFNHDKKMFTHAPHIPDWAGKPIAQKFSDALGGALIHFENDAALAALAEARRGAGKGYEIVAYITIGTGVGGARVEGGHIDRNAFGFEPGHQIIEGSNMRLEDLIGGKALEARYNKRPLEINDARVWDEVAEKLSYALVNTILYWSPNIIVLGGAISRKIPLDKVQSITQKLLGGSSEIPVIVLSHFADSSGIEGAIELLAP
ncbi:MAG: ROK family protein [Patescibacteria group bacterium]